MMNLVQFELYVARADRHRRLLARAGLNAVGFAKEFPFDIAELRHLSSEARGHLMEFLSWVVGESPRRLAELELARMREFARMRASFGRRSDEPLQAAPTQPPVGPPSTLELPGT